jgi:hypothetical protein
LKASLKTVSGEVGSRKSYISPRLVEFGFVRDLTKALGGSSAENYHGQCKNAYGPGMCSSERRVKENIVRIGDHPLGFGLYLFNYRLEHCDKWGHSRQFGVMIDEVEKVIPEAVHMGIDGYKRVDYRRLGVFRTPAE